MKTLIWFKLGFNKGGSSRGSVSLYQCHLCTPTGTSHHFTNPGAQLALEPTGEPLGAWIPTTDVCSSRGSREGADQNCLCDLWLTLGSVSGGLKLSFGLGA